ncbi:hypothetical protein [Mycobacterium sp. E796]|uniref:hypothetical protein n=1 Tax=Mycobacterium sp. E796 TaxID=1834151 RepID=UPI0012E9C62C|nr:hypothetical protein [Mycobacterium sp. E796]
MNTISAAVAVAAPVLLLFGAASAHADDNYQQFASASGNIRCILNGEDAPLPVAMCQIGDQIYSVPPGVGRDKNGGPCPPGSDLGRDFRLDQGQAPYVACTHSALGSGAGSWPVLGVGQSRSLGPMTCNSEPDGVTCTDAGTGHFFRVSRESYQLG